MRLRSKILSFALPLILIPFGLTALAAYSFFIRAGQARIEEEHHKLLAEAVVNLRQGLQEARKDLTLLAGIPSIIDYLEALEESASSSSLHRGREDGARSILQLFFNQNPYYLQLSLVDARGQERVKLSKLPGEERLESIAGEDFFRRTLITGRAQSPVKELQPERAVIFLTQRVKRESFAGAIILHLNTDIFQRSLRPLLASHRFSTFLFDDRGVVFARSLAGAEEENGLRQIDLTAEALSLLARPALDISRRELSFGGRSYLFSIHPAEAYERYRFEPQAGDNWFLAALGAKEDLSLQAGSFQAAFLLTLAAAVGAILWAATRYSRRITGPLEVVTRATARVALGQFDLDLKVATGDEVESLAAAVERMAGELKDYQARLLRSAKLAAIGEMAAEVSHEIQNRISSLSLWIQHLDAEIEAPDPRREYLEEMKLGLGGFMTLLADLKQLYKSPVLRLSRASLNRLAEEALLHVKERTRERGIEVETLFQASLPDFDCDREKIKSVIINLLANATEAVRDGEGRIEIRTQLSGDAEERALLLSVKDNGCGVAAEDLPRIFYPFFSTKASGSGLGLAIASNLVSAHGGRIAVESRAGEGATFTIALPLPQDSNVAQVVEQAPDLDREPSPEIKRQTGRRRDGEDTVARR